jgi:hypothetical protein
VNYHERKLEIMRERERLLTQCEVQRTDLAAVATQSEGMLRVIDHVVGVVRYLRNNPMMIGVAAAAVAVVQRRSLWGWVRRAFMLWRAYRAFRGTALRLKA